MEITSYRGPRDSEETLVADVAFDRALAPGQIVEVAWTKSTDGRRGNKKGALKFRANARVLRVNTNSVRVALLEDAVAGEERVATGSELAYVPRWPIARWPDKGVFPRSTHVVEVFVQGELTGACRCPDYELALALVNAQTAKLARDGVEGATVLLRALP